MINYSHHDQFKVNGASHLNTTAGVCMEAH